MRATRLRSFAAWRVPAWSVAAPRRPRPCAPTMRSQGNFQAKGPGLAIDRGHFQAALECQGGKLRIGGHDGRRAGFLATMVPATHFRKSHARRSVDRCHSRTVTKKGSRREAAGKAPTTLRRNIGRVSRASPHSSMTRVALPAPSKSPRSKATGAGGHAVREKGMGKRARCLSCGVYRGIWAHGWRGVRAATLRS